MIEGGLRCRGLLKEDSDSAPLITYITVVLNRKNTLEKCIQSVLSQKNSNFEYVIIDGSSSDGTLDIIMKYADEIDYYISEEDSGIYNAMNKGLGLARGRLVCFMNSDDECLPNAAETVTKYYKKCKPDLICGGRILRQGGKVQDEFLFERFPIKHCRFRYIQMFHQSTYALRELFEKIGKFDEQYALLSDWVWESEAIDAGAEICFINEKLSVFNYDGASFKEIARRDKEWVQWIRSSFNYLSNQEAWFLLNCLDHGRHPFVLISTIRKISDKYKDDKLFAKVIYETSLCMLLEDLDELSHIYLTNNLDLNRFWNNYQLEKKYEYKSIKEVRESLSSTLDNSLRGCMDFPNYDDIMDIIRDFKAKAYYNFQIKVFTKSYKMKYLLFVLKQIHMNCSYISRKSVFMSFIYINVVCNDHIIKLSQKLRRRKRTEN